MGHPLIYEINTRCWLAELSERHGVQITLANLPETEFTRWRKLGFTHIWLMGVWSIGPKSRAFSRQVAPLREIYSKRLPDFSEEDYVGSAYAIPGYEVSEALGGEPGLSAFRKKLNETGPKLILDFIPNHTGLDHPWLKTKSELFVQSPAKAPGTFREKTSEGLRWIAHGKDPYFPAWADTAQLDYRNSATRAAVIEELKSIALRCDGVRCDMAMLVLDDIFPRTWRQFSSHAPEDKPEPEFWAEAISTIKAAQPEFLFLAEAYWGLEKRLLDLGFDFAYDKEITDHLLARRHPELRQHLFASGNSYLSKSVHFLENHDEPRIASLLSFEEHRAAALLMVGLPGARLLHEGQLSGATLRASVHLQRRPIESPEPEITAFYALLLASLQTTAIGGAASELLRPAAAWPGNPTAENFVLVQWQATLARFDVVVVNLAAQRSQCSVKLTVEGLGKRNWNMIDLLGPERYERNGRDLEQQGLYLDLPAHGAQLFHFEPT